MELPGLTEIAAIDNYVTVLRDSLSCVVAGDLVAAPHHEFPYTVQFGPGDPEARRHRTQPHFHIKQGAGFLGMNKLSFPSGHVAIEAIVRFLIEEMGVPSARADWDIVLTENQSRFRAY